MEVYPAARKGGRGIEGEQKERGGEEEEEEESVEWLAGRQAEESPVEPGALWYRLGS